MVDAAARSTSERAERFALDGYLRLPGFFSPSEVEALRRRMETLVGAFDPDAHRSVFSTTDRDQRRDSYFLDSSEKVSFFYEEGAVDDQGSLTVPLEQAINKVGHALHDLDPVFDSFSRHPALAELVDELGVSDPLLLQSMYIFKQPRIGGEVTWHTDHPFLWTEPSSVIGLWVAIDDATEENGCLWALPGQHHLPPKERFRRVANPDGSLGTAMTILDETPFPTAEGVPLEAPAGTLIVLHGLLPHWSAPNTSERPRHAYTVHVIDGAAEYPADNWLQRSDALPLRGFAG